MRNALNRISAYNDVELLVIPDLNIVARYAARELASTDSQKFKELRLKALKEEGHLFGPTYEEESKLPNKHWQQRCSKTNDHCYFGLFDRGALIGMMMATKWDRDNTGQTALWGGAYIRPEYRGKKLAALMYKAREKWTKNHPSFKYAVFFIREGNRRSTEIHEKQGAVHISTEPLEWPDRPAVPWRWYKKQLKS